MTDLVPVRNLGSLYVNNLEITWLTATTLSMAAGQARDSTNVFDIQLTEAVTINAAVDGANGLDQGALANSTWYAVHLIGSSYNYAEPAAMLSTSRTAPLMPQNYDIFRQIGWMLTSGAAALLKVVIYGNGNVREYFWDAPITELNAQGSATYAAIDMASAIPPTSKIAYLNWKLVPATAGNLTKLRATGSASTTNIELTGSVAAQPNAGQIVMNTNSAQSIDYINASASDDLSIIVTGFKDFI
jgi:hypothetical protein